MASSPFHGIFSSLNQGGREKNIFSFGSQEQEDTPAPAHPSHTGMQQQSQHAAQTGTGRVAVDIYEQDGYVIIKAPIAGVRLSDLDIEVEENVITIRGNRRQTDVEAEGRYFLQECFWGPFARSVTLPFQIDPKKIRATFNKECILKILIPREEKVKVVRINEI